SMQRHSNIPITECKCVLRLCPANHCWNRHRTPPQPIGVMAQVATPGRRDDRTGLREAINPLVGASDVVGYCRSQPTSAPFCVQRANSTNSGWLSVTHVCGARLG